MRRGKSIRSAEVVSGNLRFRGLDRTRKRVQQKSQAPVDRCTRTGLLPLLPSGPGGFHRIALRGTSARPTKSYHSVAMHVETDAVRRPTTRYRATLSKDAKIKGFHALQQRFCGCSAPA